MKRRTIRDYMTRTPKAIGIDESLAVAAQRMRDQGIRHLPVVQDGRLRGVIFLRGIAMLENLGEVDIRDVTCGDAMIREPYIVSAQAPIRRVVTAMREHKYSCAVVVEGAEVVGIFTTTDALRVLGEHLHDHDRDEELAPSQVRAIILAEHVHLRSLMEQAESAAMRVLGGGGFTEREVRNVHEQAEHLRAAVIEHLRLENRRLADALRKTDGFGPSRADALVAEHVEQKRMIDEIMRSLDEAGQPPSAIATAVQRLVADLRADMESEEEALLDAELLRDDSIGLKVETG